MIKDESQRGVNIKNINTATSQLMGFKLTKIAPTYIFKYYGKTKKHRHRWEIKPKCYVDFCRSKRLLTENTSLCIAKERIT